MIQKNKMYLIICITDNCNIIPNCVCIVFLFVF